MTARLLAPPATAQRLRPYQTRALDGLRRHLGSGKRRVLLVSPTGSGKTTIAAEMIRSATARGNRVLFLAHRRELIQQCSDRLDQFGVEHGVIMGTHPRHMPWLPVQVASVQTLARRMTRADGTPHPSRPTPDLVIIDEAHHARAGTYLGILKEFPGVASVGLTATPWRGDGKGLGELFEASVIAATPAELIGEGHLVHFSGFSYEIPDLDGVRVKGNDYDGLELAQCMSTAKMVGGIVEKYLEHAAGKRAVVFAVSVEHSQKIAAEFVAAGIAAEHLDGEAPNELRAAILARLASGATLVVSNVGVLTEGWDCPAVEVCILARPTKSCGLFMQMVGRALRPFAGKELARIHDHAGCMVEHGTPDMDRDYSLEADSKKAKKSSGPAVLVCPACMCTCPHGADVCPECGEVFEVRKRGREVMLVEGVAMTIDQIRALHASHAETVSRATMTDKAAEWKRLDAVRRRKGFQPGFVAHAFKDQFGVWPRIPQELLDATPAATEPFIPLDVVKKIKAATAALDGPNDDP